MDDWSGQKVVILGAARQGLALARYLSRKGARVVLNDRRSEAELLLAREAMDEVDQGTPPIEWVFGEHPLSLLEGADWLCISGGVPLTLPLVVEAQARGIPLTNDSQIFLESAPCKVIGITGSAGKTTTTTLVGRMAIAALEYPGSQTRHHVFQGSFDVFPSSPSGCVWVGGNIGSPLIADLDAMGPDDLAVMELSSFQLELMTRSPHIAAVLNVTPNHLDRHGTMQAYTAAKARILEFQSSADVAVLGREDPGAWGLAEKVRGKLISFGVERPVGSDGAFLNGDEISYSAGSANPVPLFSRQQIQLRGEHNLLNVLGACAIAASAGLPPEAMRAGVEGFRGVPHRLEYVRSWGGADWYNDSIATAPERAMAALRSFDEPLVLLAGGRDKNLPWEDFAAFVRQRVRVLVLFGEAAGKIAEAFGDDYYPTRCSGLDEAVQAAARLVEPGDVVLLSPGGTSFDEFADFEERGECFRRLVNQL
jgi:UDP-N-acetylmuramoylalanine--D-glutamate ligase